MADHLLCETIPAHQTVIREGEAGDKFYLIRTGRVSVQRAAQSQPLAILKEGDFFGEMALLTGHPRNASVVALEETVLYSLSQDKFRQAIAQQASFESEIRRSLFDRQ